MAEEKTVKDAVVTEKIVEERDREVANSIINFYNHRTLCEISTAVRNQNIVFKALDKSNGNIALLKEHIKVWLDANDVDDFEDDGDRFKACFTEFTPDVPINKETFTVMDSLSLISRAVTETVKATCLEKVETEVKDTLQEEVRTFINDTYGPIERKIITIVDGNKRELKGVLHEKFDEILKCVANNIPVYLVGPAGSGKNVICKQVADALGLKFYFSNAVTQEYKITGFTDANGNYQATQFYKAFTEGGVFMLDEMDASIPEVLTILNAAIANKYFDFPAPIGYREAHPDFRVVAAGNTSGHGADYQYVGRNQLDEANLNRFIPVKVGYSKTIEDSLSTDIELVDFCRDFRTASNKVGVNTVISYRNISYLDTLSKLVSLEEAVQMCLVKDLEKDDVNHICNELKDSKFKTALRTVWATM